MRIAFARAEDLDHLVDEDRHVPPGVIEQKVERRENHIPFMIMLWVKEGLRGNGFGTRLIAFLEDEMRESGHDTVMTSTLSSERAQHLYRKLGYQDCGALIMPGETSEIPFSKVLHRRYPTANEAPPATRQFT